MKRLAAWMAFSAVACTEPLPVRDPPPVEDTPEFLGPLSGVYAGLSDDNVERTVVVQLGDTLLLSPVSAVRDPVTGEVRPQLSIFANVIPIDTSNEGNPSATFDGGIRLFLPPSFLNPTGGLDDTTVRCMNDATAPSLPGYVAGFAACVGSPSCAVHCWRPNPFTGGILAGTCSDNPGDFCRFELTVGGRASLGTLEMYFDQATFAPPASLSDITCPERLPPQGQSSVSPWLRCLQVPKKCDFDSRFAGVYTGTLTPRGGGSALELQLAVAVAHNLPAVILFINDTAASNRLHKRVMVGLLDLGTYVFTADDGTAPGQPAWDLRDGAEPHVTVTAGSLVLAGDVVGLTATWTERTSAGDTIYDLSAERRSGVTAGQACTSLASCEAQALTCPLGLDTNGTHGLAPAVFRTDLSAEGCLRSDCTRLLRPAAGLCAHPDTSCASPPCPRIPECGGLAFDDVRYELMTAGWACPGGAASCATHEECVQLDCYDGDPAVSLSENWFSIDTGCDPETTPMSLEARSESWYVRCAPGGAACQERPPVCPLGISEAVQSNITPRVGGDGCVEYDCQQVVRPDQLCAVPSATSCTGGDQLVPQVRRTQGQPDCVDPVCTPPCSTPECVQDGDDPSTCGTQAIVVGGCNDCLRVTCGGGTCEAPRVDCALPTNNGALISRASAFPDENGCVRWACDQLFSDNQECAGHENPTTLPACPPGQARQPQVDTPNNCIHYPCLPSCLGGPDCDDCTCADPVLTDTCGADGHLVSETCGCLALACGVLP